MAIPCFPKIPAKLFFEFPSPLCEFPAPLSGFPTHLCEFPALFTHFIAFTHNFCYGYNSIFVNSFIMHTPQYIYTSTTGQNEDKLQVLHQRWASRDKSIYVDGKKEQLLLCIKYYPGRPTNLVINEVFWDFGNFGNHRTTLRIWNFKKIYQSFDIPTLGKSVN